MKKLLLALFLLLPMLANADTYDLSVVWQDPTGATGAAQGVAPTPPVPAYTPLYDVEVTNGVLAPVVTSGLVAPSFNKVNSPGTATIVAAPSTVIKVRFRERNTTGPMVGNWSAFMTATAPLAPVMPSDPTNGAFTTTWSHL